MSEPLEIRIAPDRRLVVSRWHAPSGRLLVAVTPEYRARGGGWHLQHSALAVPPEHASRVAAAVLEIAATIDAGPVDPEPTAEDRELSRMP